MITTQNEMLDAYITERGYILAGETVVLENGNRRDRNSIKAILREAENKSYDILLISHLDRLMRETIPCMELCRELLEMGIRIIPVKSGIEFTLKMIEPYSFIKEAQKNRYKHNVPHGTGCDDERCPVYGGQLIGCDCEDMECPTGK